MSDIKIYEELQELVTATRKKRPKRDDLLALERLLDNNPELWRIVDLAQSTALRAIQSETPEKGTQTLMRYNYEGIKSEHGYEQANALERLMIEHTALCWIRLNCIEQRYTQVMKQSISLKLAEHWEKRLSAAQQRYLRAAESLAKIKRLRLPAVQVNIADKQVNIAGE